MDRSRAVDHLADLGYATRDRDPRDRRRSVIALTEEGRAATARCGRAVREVADDVLEPLSVDERESLSRILDQVFGQL